MASTLIRRHYPIPELGFQEFWDLCCRFQTLHSAYQSVYFTVDSEDGFVVLDEPEVSRVLKKLAGKESRVRKYTARLYTNRSRPGDDYRVCELHYRTSATPSHPQGLSFYGDAVDKVCYHQFEEAIDATYPCTDNHQLEVEYGKPCEVLALIIDIRGFTVFCEQPQIESPYICGLMSAFYNMVNRSLQRFPPDMIKLLGDGVLAIWQTTPADRELAVQVALEAALRLRTRWKQVQNSPHFSHGAPDALGAGLCFGLASHLEVVNDYIGRPINIASRLCGACPGDRVYVDRAMPNIPLHLKKEDYVTHIRPYGRHHIWAFTNQEM